MGDLETRLLDDIRSIAPSRSDWEVPPPVMREMEAAFESYREGRSLTLSYPLFERYASPTGMVQGGVLAAAFDNAYGPLAFLAASSAAVSLSLDVSYMRPLPVGGGPLEVVVELVERTRRVLFLEGEARDPREKLVATSTSEMLVVEDLPTAG